jgi:hypothetical protein
MTVKGPGPGGARARAAARAARVVLVVSVVVLGLVAAVSPARAHPEFSALGTNRTVTAAVFDGRVEVSDVWLEGLLVSADDRRRFDADGDGRLTEAELTTAAQRLAAEGAAVAVTLDGRALTDGAAPVGVSIDLGGEPLVADAPVAVERRLSFPGVVGPGAHTLRIAIAREAPHPLDTEIDVLLGPALTLAGPDRVTFRGPRGSALEERVGTFAFTAPAPPASRVVRRVLAITAAAALGALGLAVALRRRRRSARG